MAFDVKRGIVWAAYETQHTKCAAMFIPDVAAQFLDDGNYDIGVIVVPLSEE